MGQTFAPVGVGASTIFDVFCKKHEKLALNAAEIEIRTQNRGFHEIWIPRTTGGIRRSREPRFFSVFRISYGK